MCALRRPASRPVPSFTQAGISPKSGRRLGRHSPEAEVTESSPNIVVIPPRLSFELFEVGIGGQGAEPTSFGCERGPGGAAGVHDGLVIGEQPVREVAVPEIQPHALDW